MAVQETLRASTTGRKHNHRMWAEKKHYGGGGGVAGVSGGGAAQTFPRDRMKVNIVPPAPPGFIALTPPVGGDAVIPFGNIVIPSLNNDLTNPVAGDIQVTQDAIYYVGVSVLLFVVGTAGVDPVKITLYKDGVAGQNIIWDYTQAGTEIEQRYHAADWIRLDDTNTLQARMVGPTIGAPISYALIDAYLDIGYGPLR